MKTTSATAKMGTIATMMNLAATVCIAASWCSFTRCARRCLSQKNAGLYNGCAPSNWWYLQQVKGMYFDLTPKSKKEDLYNFEKELKN